VSWIIRSSVVTRCSSFQIGSPLDLSFPEQEEFEDVYIPSMEEKIRATQAEEARRTKQLEGTSVFGFAARSPPHGPPDFSDGLSHTAAAVQNASPVGVAIWNDFDESSSEEVEGEFRRIRSSVSDWISEDKSGNLGRIQSRDFTGNLPTCDEDPVDTRWHEVQAVPVLDPVSGKEVCGL